MAGAIKYLLESFEWLGVDIDEGPSSAELDLVGEPYKGIGGDFGPYIQSQRLPLYKEAAEKLIATGFAYRCDCTPEMLEKERLEQMARKELPGYSGYCRTRNVSADTRHVVRFKMPHKPSITVIDAVKDRVSWDQVPMRDPVLLKSDGFPTYHLAVVVDDHHMRISHVLRSDEWLSSLPLHVLLFDAFGWEKPIFAHLPAVLGSDGKKLSKRHGATSLETFKSDGYLSQALLNYVVLVGWSPGEGDEQEIFKREDLIKKFSLDHVNKASAVFDYNKLIWMNGMYIRALSFEEFTAAAKPFLDQAGMQMAPERWKIIAPHVQERVRALNEIAPMIEFLCRDQIEREMNSMFHKEIDVSRAKQILKLADQKLSGLGDFSVAEIEGALRGLAAELNLKPGPMFGVLRVAVTGKKITPPLFESFSALGREATLQRIRETGVLLENVPAQGG